MGAKDVCDCWVDSSITPMVISGWPEEKAGRPVDLRQQGSEIIRTWAFYSIVQSYLQQEKVPFNTALVNGMILGPDGKAMSSSLGNVIDPLEAIERHSADSLRQALLLTSPGGDFPFNWKDIRHCSKFLQKIWNASRFASLHLSRYEPKERTPRLHLIDRWILSRLQTLIEDVTNHMDVYRFDQAVQELQGFLWHEYCDYYLEFIKHRLYEPKHEWFRRSAQHTLYNTLRTLLQLLAPIAPHITEEIYQRIYAKYEKSNTIHLSKWPKVQSMFVDKKADKAGKTLKRTIAAIRKHKSDRSLPLPKPLSRATIYCGAEEDSYEALCNLKEDIKQIGKIARVDIRRSPIEKPPTIFGNNHLYINMN